MTSVTSSPRALALQALALAALALHVAHTGFGVGDGALGPIIDQGVYNALMLACAGACLLRGVRRREDRWAWLLLGGGAASWALGDLHYSLVLADRAEPPFPSLSDALYLAWYPACLGAVALLVRRHIEEFRLSLGVDALTGALATGAVAAAVLYDAVAVSISGDSLSVLVTLAYPIADVLLVAFVVGLLALTGWVPGRTWSLIGGALVLAAVGDAVYLVLLAQGTYAEGTLLDAVWPASLLLLAFAAWRPSRFGTTRLESGLLLFMPGVFGLTAMGLLIVAQVRPLNGLAVGLACATIGALLLRMAVTLAENLRMVAASRGEALTDALTGLGNRRRLVADLEARLAEGQAGDRQPHCLLLFDLDGFKRYNDSFGHLAGDALLARLGAKLAAAVADCGDAYRLGGDEFCAVVRLAPDTVEALLSKVAAALSETGEGFAVTSSYGAVVMPHEAADVPSAMQLADQRMYSRKDARSPVREQTRDVLLRALEARQPPRPDRPYAVAELAAAVARRLGVQGEELDEIARAAELHDVGKVAVPDAILDKPAALDDEEWAFMRRHTLLGERILNGAPAMRPVARLVRSTHERFDGRGYPDGLRGAEIPLGSRVVAVVDAYEAMTEGRPYRGALDAERAARELRRGSGTQFDPTVVEAFVRELGERTGAAEGHDIDHRVDTVREVATQLREALHSS